MITFKTRKSGSTLHTNNAKFSETVNPPKFIVPGPHPVKTRNEKVGIKAIRQFLAKYDDECKNGHLPATKLLEETQKSIKSVQQLIEDNPELVRTKPGLVKDHQKLIKANAELQCSINASKYLNEVLCPPNLRCFSEISPFLGKSASALKHELHERRVIYPASSRKNETMESEFFSRWYPYAAFSDKGLFNSFSYLYQALDGTNHVADIMKVTEKGRMFIIELFRNPQLTAKEVYRQTFINPPFRATR